ncbi:MAG: hypothetical protein R3348_06495, partial [Xanthomonadales bacterium]|nr:hypothetical protein [Xanthomonadales bacterium]
MTLTAAKLKAWLDILATLAVVAGLFLLVHEIRMNTRAIALQAQVNRAEVLAEPFFASSLMLTGWVIGPSGQVRMARVCLSVGDLLVKYARYRPS